MNIANYQIIQSLGNTSRLMSLLFIMSLTACTATPQAESVAGMHPSWDIDGDGLNDCEKEDSCDHTVDYRLARNTNSKPSFDCSSEALVAVEKLICQSPELAVLDVQLAKVFKQAVAASKEPTPGPSFLQTEQKGWIKGRNACWKSEDLGTCISDSYRKRIAQLQARYRLVESLGPVRYECSDSPADELLVTYYMTEPKTLISERGDAVSLMFLSQAASGTKYIGKNESFWLHQGEVILHWGINNAELRCQQVSND